MSDPQRNRFVGRDQELAALEERTETAASGRSQIVLVEGDPGIGKSALLAEFSDSLSDALILRATCDEDESLVSLGLIGQLVTAAEQASPAPGGLADRRGQELFAVADRFTGLLRELQPATNLIVLLVDDLQWADRASAVALLHALRQIRADPVLAVFAVQPSQFVRLGQDWQRFLSHDSRVTRLRLAGLNVDELVMLALAIGVADLSRWAAIRLIEHTAGNPLHCCALLEELDPAAWSGVERLPAPRDFAYLVLGRLAALALDTQQFVSAAAVLGRRCQFDVAGALARIPDPLEALEEALEAGFLVETRTGPATQIGFPHALVHSAVYHDLGPARRRRMHARAAELVVDDENESLSHRAAASAGRDDQLAVDLEKAAVRALGRGQPAQAAAWLAQSSAATIQLAERDRRELDAVELLLDSGSVVEADALLASDEAFPMSARRTVITGEIDLLAGRFTAARAGLETGWRTHDPTREPLVGARAALLLASLCALEGRLDDALRWSDKAEQASGPAPALKRQAIALRAITLTLSRRETEALASLALPEFPGDVPVDETELLAARGVARIASDDLASVVADLSTVADRLAAGIAGRNSSQCLSWLANAEFRLGAWNEALHHGERAVGLAQQREGLWNLGFAHALATRAPAARGDWTRAVSHLEAAREAPGLIRSAMGLAAVATARASLASARGEHDEVVRAAREVRASGRPEVLGASGIFDWRVLEVDALTALGEYGLAEVALGELTSGHRATASASDIMSAARLAGNLACARGNHRQAERAFRAARAAARRLQLPFQFALVEIGDAGRLRAVGRRAEAIGLLRTAHARLVGLGALPYVDVCDRALAACGAEIRHRSTPGELGLTQAELAVARLVAQGRSNRETADALYLSVKTIEFHLRNIFTKLDVSRRGELASRLGGPGDSNLGSTTRVTSRVKPWRREASIKRN
ncbi:MAG TPA: LuxR family transcriptional regulator [Solirubrobacteraceae bacterium]|jgi:DNA-binding CsgD family transcriptional regulator